MVMNGGVKKGLDMLDHFFDHGCVFEGVVDGVGIDFGGMNMKWEIGWVMVGEVKAKPAF
ncbi:hypothetical protein [Bacillus altitudinis]|uniref:hypothetical protein n=1 Tax=Bacillus altitudinis TaxID=293387 RepID=UPI001643BCB1|nr:hypothetical protein [Bacillus altitudinis]